MMANFFCGGEINPDLFYCVVLNGMVEEWKNNYHLLANLCDKSTPFLKANSILPIMETREKRFLWSVVEI